MSKTFELPVPGDLFAGKYRIQRLLGRGGMGAVFAAHHEGLNKRVAVKFLLAEAASNEEAKARFKQEAQSASGLRNEHVAQVYDVSTGEDGGLPFMVMEYLDGQDLSQLLETQGWLPPEVACDYLMQALDAIHAAHRAKIVHRDLQPSNLFLARLEDGSTVVKVLDFGISKAQNGLGPMSGALTSTKAMLGSPLYMSPEQLRSSKSVDARADIWALGVILYELLTGTVPYTGENLGELFAAILEQEPLPVRQRAPHVPPELESVVMRCLQRQVHARFSSVAELAMALVPFAPARASLPVVAAGRALPHGGALQSPLSYTAPMPNASQAGFPHPHHLAPLRPPSASAGGFASITANPVNVPIPNLTPPLGAGGIAPPPLRRSGADWESSSAASLPVQRGPGLVIGLSAVGLVALVALGIGGYKFYATRAVHAGLTPELGSSSPEPVPVAVSSASAHGTAASAAPGTSGAPSADSGAVAVAPAPPVPPVPPVPSVPPVPNGKKLPMVPVTPRKPPVTPSAAPVTPPPPTTQAPAAATTTPPPASTLQTSR